MNRILRASFLICFSGLAIANTIDKTPFTIESNDFHFDYKIGNSVYQGDVVFKQGKSLAKADKVEIFLTGDKKLKQLVASGNPAHYSQNMEDGSTLEASAQKIIYNAKGLLVLENKASIQQAGNLYQAERIEIDTITEQLRSTSGRTKIVVSPSALNQIKTTP